VGQAALDQTLREEIGEGSLRSSFQDLLAASVAIGLMMTVLGLALSYRYALPSGPSIILLSAALLYALALCQATQRRVRTRTR
jgi:ABC-type Mn2+/Zn2+ transport system permease subunit